MPALAVSLLIHDHQPPGTPDDVLAARHGQATAPLLDFLESHPAFRVALHASGPRLEWLAARAPEALTRLRGLVERGQVEPWGGGCFEPILGALDERDRLGQLATLADWIERLLGRRPAGAWVAESVWEPSLAASLADAGVRLTALDDDLFAAAGLDAAERFGPVRLEHARRSVAALAVPRDLVAGIPFVAAEEIVARLERVATDPAARLALLVVPLEWLGADPGTRERAWDDGWLETLAGALASNPALDLVPPLEALAAHPPRCAVHLGESVPAPLGERLLAPSARARSLAAAAALDALQGAGARTLLRGGTWRGWQLRHPSVERRLRRIALASERLDADGRRGTPEWLAALGHLWRAQCGDVAGPGAHGGLDRPHVRAAVDRERIAVERFLAPAAARIETLPGGDDVRLAADSWIAWIGARGGALWGFDDLEQGIDWCDAGREREADGERQVASFLDAWIEGGRRLALAEEPYALTTAADAVIAARAAGDAPAVEKRFVRGADGALEIEYRLHADRARLGKLEIALALALHGPDSSGRSLEIEGAEAGPGAFGARGRHEAVTRVACVNAAAGRRLELWIDRRASLDREPRRASPPGDAGAAPVLQGLALRFTIAVALEPSKPWRCHVRLAPVDLRVAV